MFYSNLEKEEKTEWLAITIPLANSLLHIASFYLSRVVCDGDWIIGKADVSSRNERRREKERKRGRGKRELYTYNLFSFAFDRLHKEKPSYGH